MACHIVLNACHMMWRWYPKFDIHLVNPALLFTKTHDIFIRIMLEIPNYVPKVLLKISYE